MKNSDVESILELRKRMKNITSSPRIMKTRQDLNKLRDEMISPENRRNIKRIKDFQNKMMTPTFRRQIRLMYRWNRLFAPDTNFFKGINRYNDVQKIRESSLNKQINQFREITKLRPSFSSELRNLSNKLAQMNTNQLHDFYNKGLKNDSTYNNYVNSNNKENKNKATNTSVKKTTKLAKTKVNNLQKHYRSSDNTMNITNNGPVTINNYNNNSNTSSIGKWSLFFSILGIILGIVSFLASNNPNQVASNLSSWTESVSKITKK